MWKKQHLDLGKIRQQTKKTVFFQYDGAVPQGFNVTKLESSCGCTTPKFLRTNGSLSVTFTAPDVPKHLHWKGEYTSTKRIKMYTKSHGDFEFTFKATITLR